MKSHLRIARPVTDFKKIKQFYCEGMGFHEIGSFKDHEGFDGLMLGHENFDYHFEFTRNNNSPVIPTPTPEDLTVFYIPDKKQFNYYVDKLKELLFPVVKSHNPYWDNNGKTFLAPDNYRVVLQNSHWKNQINR